jgi:hypothetical protein
MDFWTLRHGYTRIVVFLLNIISMIGHMSYKYGYSSLLISIYIYITVLSYSLIALI